MVKPRPAQPTVKFIDDYAKSYRDLFPEVRTFEYFKYLHLGLISELPRKSGSDPKVVERLKALPVVRYSRV
jgi:SRSO17 transposase